MENLSVKPHFLGGAKKEPLARMDSCHLNRLSFPHQRFEPFRQMLRENIKFANLNLSNNKSALSVRF